MNDKERIEQLKKENKYLKTLYTGLMIHNTVKSYNGKADERYKYDEEHDVIFDMANHYGSYHKMLDKKEIAVLLNSYNDLVLQKDDDFSFSFTRDYENFNGNRLIINDEHTNVVLADGKLLISIGCCPFHNSNEEVTYEFYYRICEVKDFKTMIDSDSFSFP